MKCECVRIEVSLCRIELDSGGRVYTPYLRIDYAEWEPDQDSHDTIRVYSSNNNDIIANDIIIILQAGFSVVYSQDIASFNITISVCVVVMVIIAGIICGLRLNGFLRRTNDLCCTVPVSLSLHTRFTCLTFMHTHTALSLFLSHTHIHTVTHLES